MECDGCELRERQDFQSNLSVLLLRMLLEV